MTNKVETNVIYTILLVRNELSYEYVKSLIFQDATFHA
jgi:hypothetical protein